MTPLARTAQTAIPLSVWVLTAICVVVGVLGLAAGWTGAALITQSQCGWLALIAAVDAALLLRLAGFPPSRARAMISVLMTLAAIGLANYFLVAARLGSRLGLEPAESVQLLSVEMAWVLAGYANSALDVAMIAVAALCAWWWGR